MSSLASSNDHSKLKEVPAHYAHGSPSAPSVWIGWITMKILGKYLSKLERELQDERDLGKAEMAKFKGTPKTQH